MKRAVVAGVLATGIAFGAAAPALAALPQASTPTPQPVQSGGSGKVIKVPANTVTFAIGTSNGRYADGRSTIRIVTPRGVAAADHLIIYNLSTVSVPLSVYTSDAYTGAEGAVLLPSPGKAVTSAGRWIYSGFKVVVMPAKSQITVPVRVVVPGQVRPGDYAAAVVVSTIPRSDPGAGPQVIKQVSRLAMPIFIRVQGRLVTAIRVTSLKAEFTQNPWRPGFGTLKTYYTVKNVGNVRVSVRQRFAIKGKWGLPNETRVAPVLDDLLPGASVPGSFVMTNVPASVKIKVTDVATPTAIDPGSPKGRPATASTTVTAISFWGIGSVAIIFAVLALVIWGIAHLVAGVLGGGAGGAGGTGGSGGSGGNGPEGEGPAGHDAEVPVGAHSMGD